MSGTRRAQNDAEQQYQNAASAQKRASEEQQKEEQAERDVTKAQKALADAQAKLEGQRAKAAQAQRDAGELGRDAQASGQHMQEQATRLQGEEARQAKRTQQGNQQAWMQTQDITGAVAAVNPKSLTVRSNDRGDVKLDVNDSTAISLNGRAASMNEIRAGSDVRAAYGVVEGQATAVRLDITSTASSSGGDSDSTKSAPGDGAQQR